MIFGIWETQETQNELENPETPVRIRSTFQSYTVARIKHDTKGRTIYELVSGPSIPEQFIL